MLAFRHHIPREATDGAPLAVLLHGRGSDESDLLALHEHLPAGTVVVTPRAPHAGSPWGYGPGWAWYRYVEGDRVVAETLEESLDALDGFLAGLEAELSLAPGPLFLGGFSQGGTTSLSWSLSRPGRVAGVLNFSGFLPAEGIVDTKGASGLRVFWGHGRRDPAIPWALAREGRRRLEEAGAEVEARDLEIGHWIDPGEARAAARWMEAALP